ncbi:hypothetical protein KQH61_03800 [bacterium]|nr:hypothetical protein [bacterium]MCB2179026.1 hypothetical protein [bacterium]
MEKQTAPAEAMPVRSMSLWGYGVLFILGLLVALGSAYFQTNPGYMDAYYYFNGGEQIAAGQWQEEMFIWNYLGDPTGLPVPAFSYWMPLTALFAALGIKLFGGFLSAFEAAQLLFVLLAACVPPLTAALAFAITGERKASWISGALAGFSGFYLAFLTTTDSFVLYMLLGGAFFLAVMRLKRWRGFLLGMLAGLFHLGRADGLLWLGVAGLVGLFDHLEEGEKFSGKQFFGRMLTWDYVRYGLVTVAGYVLVMSPWFLRNLNVFGGIFPPGSNRALWVLSYNDLFAYPASQLTFARWWEASLGTLLPARWDALVANLQSTIVSMGMFLPGALALFGFWRNRQRTVVRLGLVGLGVLFVVMTLVFPYSGINGAYFHSGAAFVPLILAMVPDGLDALTKFSLKIFNKWEDRKIRPFYTWLVIGFAILFSIYGYLGRVIGLEGEAVMAWNEVQTRYEQVDAALEALGAAQDDLVLTANPPALAVVTGRPAIEMPNGDTDTLQQIAADYGVRWVLVEPAHPDGLVDFYAAPHDVGGLVLVETVGEVYIFRWEEVQP